MLKSHFNINKDEEEEQGPESEPETIEDNPKRTKKVVVEEEEEEAVEAEAEVARKDQSDKLIIVDTAQLKKSQVCIRLSLLGRTADNDGYAYLKASLNNMGLKNIDIISCFIHLQFLDLSANLLHLETLQVVTKLPHLILLQADKNLINSAALHKMPYLQVLIMNENHIKTVEDIFQPELSTLELGFNKLKELNFKNRMSEMKVLDFRNNQISSFANIEFPKLDSLYLAYNKITSLEGLNKLTNLRILHLRGNPIRLLNGFDKELNKLVYINLRSCKVGTMLQIKKLRVLPALETLIVKGCPVVGGTGNEAEDAAAEEDPETRTEILASLPRLKRLNKSEVSPEEREEAKALMMQWLEEGEKDEEEIEPEELQEGEHDQ